MSAKGLIFNIQRYSIHDGPGIRTLVFMKGCPLRCLWCDNPEGQLMQPEIMYSKVRCIKCWECLKVCPIEGAISKEEDKVEINRDRCNNCGECTTVCAAEALQLVGEYVTVEDVLKVVEKDRPFYEVSGGGITISGGEPLMQPEFVKELLKACKEKGINTAIETSGYADWKSIESIVDLVDIFLYDIKHMKPDKHLRLTGVSNDVILKNLRKLSELHSYIVVRIPLIPGYNDEEENLHMLATFLSELDNIVRVEILPYHRLGVHKYEQLGRGYKLKDLKPPSKEAVQKVKSFLHDNTGLPVLVS